MYTVCVCVVPMYTVCVCPMMYTVCVPYDVHCVCALWCSLCVCVSYDVHCVCVCVCVVPMYTALSVTMYLLWLRPCWTSFPSSRCSKNFCSEHELSRDQETQEDAQQKHNRNTTETQQKHTQSGLFNRRDSAGDNSFQSWEVRCVTLVGLLSYSKERWRVIRFKLNIISITHSLNFNRLPRSVS
jgi:hypothetical protein